MSDAAKPIDIRLTVRSSPRLLCAVRGLVRGYLDNLAVDPDRRETAVLAVDEACTNAIRHAYGGRVDATLDLRMWVEPEHIVIVLEDDGLPAAVDRVEQRELSRPVQQEVRPGGLGVQLIRQAFDEVSFVPGSPRGNRVTMRLRRPSCERRATETKG